MILRGLFLLAQGKASGMREFDSSVDAFYASIAPLIAFPLVVDGMSVVQGHWQTGILSFLGQLCAVLALPVMIQAFAQATGREARWLRTSVASSPATCSGTAGSSCAPALAWDAGKPPSSSASPASPSAF
jgi:hypothetical protein